MTKTSTKKKNENPVMTLDEITDKLRSEIARLEVMRSDLNEAKQQHADKCAEATLTGAKPPAKNKTISDLEHDLDDQNSLIQSLLRRRGESFIADERRQYQSLCADQDAAKQDISNSHSKIEKLRSQLHDAEKQLGQHESTYDKLSRDRARADETLGRRIRWRRGDPQTLLIEWRESPYCDHSLEKRCRDAEHYHPGGKDSGQDMRVCDCAIFHDVETGELLRFIPIRAEFKNNPGGYVAQHQHPMERPFEFHPKNIAANLEAQRYGDDSNPDAA